MPKCSNDKTKTYTGDEPSPKGLGISASAEEVGEIMVGKDGNNWIVIQTKTYKKWSKVDNKQKIVQNELDFRTLDEICYTYSYIPKVSKNQIDNETGLEDKFGGSKPFFIEGEKWPLYTTYNNEESFMRLLCQFKDPREENNILIRVFCNFYQDDIDMVYQPSIKILPIELSEENLQKQVVLESLMSPYIPYKIEKWNRNKEIKSLKFILDNYDISDNTKYQIRYLAYTHSDYGPSSEIKVGGTPIYCYDYAHTPKQDNFLQLVESRYFPFSWGSEIGIGHIYENGELNWQS